MARIIGNASMRLMTESNNNNVIGFIASTVETI